MGMNNKSKQVHLMRVSTPAFLDVNMQKKCVPLACARTLISGCTVLKVMQEHCKSLFTF